MTEPAKAEERSPAPAPAPVVEAELGGGDPAAAGTPAVAGLLDGSSSGRPLVVGSADDAAESAADRTADQVVAALHGSGAPVDPAAPGRSGTGAVRRSSGSGGVIGPAGGPLSGASSLALSQERGSGQPLDGRTRASMEDALGADLSAVRLHTGPRAAQLNRDISAAAFTVGNDVFFRDRAPDVGTPSGAHLLAHELAHVVQDGGRVARTTLRRKGDGDVEGYSAPVTDAPSPSASGPTLFMSPDGVGHKAPDPSKAPAVLFMDASGVGHKAPDSSKAPAVLHMDASGVGHKAPDSSKAPAVLHMDAAGVGHKAPDSSKAPAVLHMDAGGVGHAQADQVAKEVQAVHTSLAKFGAAFLPAAKVVRDAWAAWTTEQTQAATQEQAAQVAEGTARSAWDVEAAGSGLTVATAARDADAAAVQSENAASAAEAREPVVAPSTAAVTKVKAAVMSNVGRFAVDKPVMLGKATSSPMTKVVIGQIETIIAEQQAAVVDVGTIAPQIPTTVAATRTSADEAAAYAESAAGPLKLDGGGLFAVVAMMQQKLNRLLGAPRLSVTGLFDGLTETRLKAYQAGKGRPATGVASIQDWTDLEDEAPSAARNGDLRVEDADSARTVRPEGGLVHPTVSMFSTGGAVRELQTRLNNWRSTLTGKKPFGALKVDGMFGISTRSALKEFQSANGLKKSAEADPPTWAELDKQGVVTSGVRQFDTRQICEGMLTGGTARYGWQITGDTLIITVKMNFTGEKGHPQVATWLQDIKDVWNGFKAVEVGGGARQYDVEFRPVVSSSGFHKVRVGKPSKKNPNPRSDSANWYVNDQRKGLAPHEFGHLVGLDDEYNRPQEQYVETTGQEPSVGALAGATGKNTTAVADLLHAAITDNAGQPGAVVSRALAKVVTSEGLTQGGFARLVAQRYEDAYGFNGEADITTYFSQQCQYDWTGDLTTVNEAFSESNTSIMGTMDSAADGSSGADLAALPPHEHPVQPRHLRSFTDLLPLAMPGTAWKTEKR